MKVLILTITAGEGHNATAAAIHEALSARGVESEVLDVYQKTNRLLYGIIAKGYLTASSDLKLLYSAVYSRLEKRKSDSYRTSITRTSQALILRRVYNHIREYKPDVIVYTHVFAGVLLDVIKEKKGLTARSVGITTDFTMHPFWEETLRTDRVVIPNEMLFPAARRKGLAERQICPIGIPIRAAFAAVRDKAEARRALGLDPHMRTLLLMGGSMGYGDLPGTLCELDEMTEDFQIMVVCGNNKKAKSEIDSLTLRKRILTFGYTSEIDLLMDAADCIVTKPGGLTTSEALAKRLPMIICNPIPGQEDRNTEFLLNSGTAMKISKTSRLADVIHQLFCTPDRIRIMQEAIDLIRKPNSTATLADLIVSLGEEKLAYESIPEAAVPAEPSENGEKAPETAPVCCETPDKDADCDENETPADIFGGELPDGAENTPSDEATEA